MTVKFLIKFVLVGAMLISAQHCMNLPFGWARIGYLTIFAVALAIWTFLHQDKCEICYNEGIKTGEEIEKLWDTILDNADEGKDEFIIKAPNEVIFTSAPENLMALVIDSRNGNYKYKVGAFFNYGKETEVTFTKI